MARKPPKEAIEEHQIADRDLQSQRRLRQAESDLRVEKAKLVASEKEVAELKKRVEFFDKIATNKPAKEWKYPKRKRDGEATAIIALSDWHIDQSVRPDRVSGLNEFTLDIADERIKTVFDRSLLLLEDSRHLVPVGDIVIWLGGDFIHSFLHEENAADNTLHPFEACRWACDRIEAGLRQVIAHAEAKRIKIVTSVGNHGRNSKKMPASALTDTSYEYNMYLELRRRFANEIDWQIGTGYFNYLNIYDFPIRFHHGDRIKFGGGINGIGVPAYRFIANANTKRRAYADIYGHFHCFGWPGCFISNGSLVGIDEYSQAMSGDTEPKQAFALVDRNRGITRALPIFAR